MTKGIMQGILPQQAIQSLLDNGSIKAPLMGTDGHPEQIQPASLDLRLGYKAYRLRASFLPGENRKVADCLGCLLYTSPSPRDRTRSRMPSSA